VTRSTKAGPAGATPRTDYPPFGDQPLRLAWTERLAEVTNLGPALELLLEWRGDRRLGALEEADFLWIEARIEDRVAVLRFAELSGEFIDTTTLTGEPIVHTCDAALEQARTAVDVATLEAVVAGFRHRYKPPVMPTVPFMRTETELTELLILRRSKDWFGQPLDELRRLRAAVLVTEGVAPEVVV
jgi:methane monooxygenase component A gamma chain